ncbi:hypothetical protein M9H77_35711 [Catharanthus roseus]|uniref:Uncharacterized protein n=1 Tax=Catharanthus roseus TaxID=4058 RepID=A0ACB9ZSC7_CATRO|nr:hypothetical protein M9H77_35711 [Catharanthus roseus]
MSNLYIARSRVITIFLIMSQHATSTTSWGRIRISIIHFPLKSLALFSTPFLFHVWRIECQLKRNIPPKVLTQDRMKIRLTLLPVPETRIGDLTIMCVVIPSVAEPLAALPLLHYVFDDRVDRIFRIQGRMELSFFWVIVIIPFRLTRNGIISI